MTVRTCEFRGDLALDGGSKLCLHIRITFEGPNQIALTGRAEASAQIEPFCSGRIEGDHDGMRVSCDNVVVLAIADEIGMDLRREIHMAADTVNFASAYTKKALRGIVLPPTSAVVGQWRLSGSRFLAALLEEGELDLNLGGLGTAGIALEAEQKLDVLPKSGHAVTQRELTPVVTITVPVGGKESGAIEGLFTDLNGLVGSLCSCLSFYSRATVEWLEWEAIMKHDETEPQTLERSWCFRRVALGPLDMAQHSAPREVRLRLSSSVLACAKWGSHLRSAIEFYVASWNLSEESRFMALTTAMEAIKEAYSGLYGGKTIVDGKIFERMKDAMAKAAEIVMESDKEGSSAGEEFRRVREKMAELNRPSYRTVVEDMCAALAVDVRAIYPRELTFIRIRNDMLHTGRVPDMRELASESGKLGKLVERLILAALNGALGVDAS